MVLRRLFARHSGGRQKVVAAGRAGQLFDGGDNCAQAVLQATLGDVDPRLLQVGAAFGAGIGGEKCLCGAVSGGVMALGLSGRQRHAGALVRMFRDRNRTTCCRALSAPYRWMSRDHLANCRRLTIETAELVESLLQD